MADEGPRWWVMLVALLGAMASLAGIVSAVYGVKSFEGDEAERASNAAPATTTATVPTSTFTAPPTTGSLSTDFPDSPDAPVEMTMQYESNGTDFQIGPGQYQVPQKVGYRPYVQLDFYFTVTVAGQRVDPAIRWSAKNADNGKVFSGNGSEGRQDFDIGHWTLSASAYLSDRDKTVSIEPYRFTISSVKVDG